LFTYEGGAREHFAVCLTVVDTVIVFKMDGLPFLPGNNFTNPTVSM